MTDFKTIELCKNLKFGNPPPKPNTIPLKDIIKANAGNEENKEKERNFNQFDTDNGNKHPEETGKKFKEPFLGSDFK